MTSDKQHGAPVRVERHDPDVVANTIKVRDATETTVREVSHLEGLKINEATAFKVLTAAADALIEARIKYEEAKAAYRAASKARHDEEYTA